MLFDLVNRTVLHWLDTCLVYALRKATPFVKWWSRKVYPSSSSYRIFRLPRHVVLKTGRTVRSAEATAMSHVASKTRIPVSHVYKFWTLSNGDGAILMEWLNNAFVLEQRWPNLTPAEKKNVALELRSFVQQLRSLPQPETMQGMICAVDGSTCWDERLKSQRCGPFASERTFNEFQLNMLDHFLWEEGARKDIENIRSRLRDDYRIMFTHGDLGLRNVLVDKFNNVLALIDWEMAGWMLEYWEYVKTIHGRWHDEEWRDIAHVINDPSYEDELDVDDQYLVVNGSPF